MKRPMSSRCLADILCPDEINSVLVESEQYADFLSALVEQEHEKLTASQESERRMATALEIMQRNGQKQGWNESYPNDMKRTKQVLSQRPSNPEKEKES